MEAFIRWAQALLGVLNQELAAFQRPWEASDGGWRFIRDLLEGRREAATSGPPGVPCPLVGCPEADGFDACRGTAGR